MVEGEVLLTSTFLCMTALKSEFASPLIECMMEAVKCPLQLPTQSNLHPISTIDVSSPQVSFLIVSRKMLIQGAVKHEDCF